ncbi:MAG: DUF7563 family protein [Haloferacaceae archaeon]
MPKCGNCGSHVSDDYVRVLGVDGEVGGCPSCEYILEGNEWRPTFAAAHGSDLATDGGAST